MANDNSPFSNFIFRFQLGADLRRAQLTAKQGDLAGARKLLGTLKPEDPTEQAQVVLIEAQLLRDAAVGGPVLETVERLRLQLADFRVKVDDRDDVSPGFKYNDWELRGVPLRIEIVLPSAELPRVLPAVEAMVTDGIVAVEALEVHSHRTTKRLIPRHLRVCDACTAPARTVTPATPVADVIRLLLTAGFNGVPVVDAEERVVGLVTIHDVLGELLGQSAPSPQVRVRA